MAAFSLLLQNKNRKNTSYVVNLMKTQCWFCEWFGHYKWVILIGIELHDQENTWHYIIISYNYERKFIVVKKIKTALSFCSHKEIISNLFIVHSCHEFLMSVMFTQVKWLLCLWCMLSMIDDSQGSVFTSVLQVDEYWVCLYYCKWVTSVTCMYSARGKLCHGIFLGVLSSLLSGNEENTCVLMNHFTVSLVIAFVVITGQLQ